MSAAMYIEGCALWSPEFADVRAWFEGRPAPARGVPAAALLPPRARGRASLVTGMLAETIAAVAREGGRDPGATPLLIGSAYGEMATTAQLLEMMCSGDGALSPARFQASVHNAAAGAISIATGNRGFSSCLSAGAATWAAVLIEACAFLSAEGGSLIAAVADEPLPAFLEDGEGFGPFSAALLLAAEPSARALARIAAPQPLPVARGDRSERDAQDAARNPAAEIAPLLRAVMARRVQSIALPGLRFDVEPYGDPP